MKLEGNLGKAHQANDPTKVANTVTKSWITAYGPTFANWRVRTLNRILQTIAMQGFREIGSHEPIAELCETVLEALEDLPAEQSQSQIVVRCRLRVAAAASHAEPGVHQTPEAGCPVNIRAPGYFLQRPGRGEKLCKARTDAQHYRVGERFVTDAARGVVVRHHVNREGKRVRRVPAVATPEMRNQWTDSPLVAWLVS
jgi:hypothetical protein